MILGTQKSANRLRTAFESDGFDPPIGPVEADETYMGGKERDIYAKVRQNMTGD